jgi:hypothetical protein
MTPYEQFMQNAERVDDATQKSEYEQFMQNAERVDETPVEPPKTAEETFADELKFHADKRWANVKDTYEEVTEGEAGILTGSIATLTQPVGFVVDTIGEVAGEVLEYAADGVSFLIRDDLEEEAKQRFIQGANYLMNHPKAIEGLNAIKEGAKSYDIWKQANPTAARAIEGIIDVAALFAPSKGTKTDVYSLKDSKEAGGFIAPIAYTLVNSAGKEVENENAKHIFKLITPVKPDANKLVQKDDLLKTNIYVFDDAEEETAKAFVRAGVTKGMTAVKTREVVSQSIENEARGLANRLSRSSVTLSDDVINDSFTRIAQNTKSNQNFITAGNLDGELTRVLVQVKSLLEKNGTTPAGILKTRQELDKFVKEAKGDVNKLMTNDKVTSLEIAYRNARNELNVLVQKAADLDPEINKIDVAKSLQTQSAMYRGLDIVKEKAVNEGHNVVTRLFKNINASAEFNLPKTPLGQAATISAGVGAGAVLASQYPAQLMAGSGVLLTMILGRSLYNGRLNRETRKYLGQMLSKTDEAIKAAQQRGLVKQVQAMKADRAYVVDLLRSMPSEEEYQKRKSGVNRSIEKLEDKLARWEASRERAMQSLEGGSNIPELFRDEKKIRAKLERLYTIRDSI